MSNLSKKSPDELFVSYFFNMPDVEKVLSYEQKRYIFLCALRLF